MNRPAATRVGLVGAGYIASTHLEALSALGGVTVGAVIDPNLKAAQRMAGRVKGARAFASLDEAAAAGAVDRVHILAPPQFHHELARTAIMAGLPTLVEKPLGVTPQEAQSLVDLARERNVVLGVNQNYMFSEGVERFAAELARGAYGRLRHISMVCGVPLRQLVARQFGHWMFERPSNIILEQMVHPMSQLVRLLGQLSVTAAVARPAFELGRDMRFHQAFDVSFRGDEGTAQLHMAFGEAYPAWQLQCLCDDGLVVIDVVRAQVLRQQRTRYLEQADIALSSTYGALSQMGQAASGLFKYGASQLKLRGRADPFYLSMLASIRNFHEAVDQGRAPLADGALGAHLVSLCADIGRLAQVSDAPVSPPRTLVGRTDVVPAFDVAVLGGTGFIGKAVVEQLLVKGHRVGVIARNVRGLPSVFHDERVVLVQGDVTRRDDIERSIGKARYVINLAHGGGGATREAIVDALAGSARMVGEVCVAKSVERLVHISSIAALYLGGASETITVSTAPDARGSERGDYAFAKGEAERKLLALHKETGLNVSIQRPGVVVGDGASPFHSGLGLFNNDQHCMGWTDGMNELPFVLVEDCARAIVCALEPDAAVAGRTDNIVGGVRITARDYLEELARALGRPLRFHAGRVWRMQGVEIAKWLVKRAGGRAVPFPAVRDLQSRGMRARFDTSDTERALKWEPVRDRARFIESGIRVPAKAYRLD